MRQDIAVLTRGQVISEDLGVQRDTITRQDLGRAKRVTITKDTTMIPHDGAVGTVLKVMFHCRGEGGEED